MLIDANLLLYAVDERAARHRAAVGWLSEQLNGSRRVGLPWQSLAAFLRIGTHPRAFPRPLTPAAAFDIVDLKTPAREWDDAHSARASPVGPAAIARVGAARRFRLRRFARPTPRQAGRQEHRRARQPPAEFGRQSACRPNPTARCAACSRRADTIHGRPRRPGRRCRTGCDRPCGRRC